MLSFYLRFETLIKIAQIHISGYLLYPYFIRHCIVAVFNHGDVNLISTLSPD